MVLASRVENIDIRWTIIPSSQTKTEKRETREKNTNPLLLEQIQLPLSFGVEGSSNRRPCCHTSAEVRP